ncbi:lipid A biosynthesis lauroyl acyltransferase [Chlamydiifrater volucris]|uniref:LpxL/LpxP family acyltransferase n=1 Tax=Chlamydiifrater volucris TaxID=2681470 RepID=UPI001BCFD555|nr:lipid A biosynthesis lauroyl acyltransferase [Chlamydiifrater volucris]
MKRNSCASTRSLRKTFRELPLYLSISTIIRILNYFPTTLIHSSGKILGKIAYKFLKDYRNTALRNLALAYPKKTFSEREKIAKQSFAHLGITLLEILSIGKIAKKIDNIVRVETESTKNPSFPAKIISDLELEESYKRLSNGQGLIAFCGHQANWELPFLFITKNYSGLALAKTVKNQLLNRKICKLRELYKGKITSPENGINKCLKALNLGKLVGIVGDQALLMSTYSYPLFGNEAWTTVSPALLAYKTSCPVVAITISREPKGYVIRPSPPLVADKNLPPKEACSALMDQLMHFLETGIRYQPEQWMWLHKRWKKKLSPSLKKKFSFSRVLILLNEDFIKKSEIVVRRWLTMFKGTEITMIAEDPYSKQFIENLALKHPETILTFLPSGPELFSTPNIFEAFFDCTNNKMLRTQLKKTGTSHIFHMAKRTNQELFAITENFFK